jgi:membrane protein YqaA with SNARE-associated domain
MLKRTYEWCIDAADKPYALWILAAVAFAESSFFPIPPDIMLLPMSLARPKKAWWFRDRVHDRFRRRRRSRIRDRRAAL